MNWVQAMANMSELMQSPAQMQVWMADKRKKFDALPDLE